MGTTLEDQLIELETIHANQTYQDSPCARCSWILVAETIPWEGSAICDVVMSELPLVTTMGRH